jgi:flagellar protein FliL
MSVVDMPKTVDSQLGQDPAEAKGGGKKKLVVLFLVVALVGGAGYWFFLKPSGPEKAPEPGVVVKLDAIQINLADDHYLKVGIALQASKSAAADLDGSKALDQTIDVFSGKSMAQLGRPAYRQRMKKLLEHRLEDAYDGDVIGVYFTDFVTQ